MPLQNSMGSVFLHRFPLLTLGTMCQAVKLEAPEGARGECSDLGPTGSRVPGVLGESKAT